MAHFQAVDWTTIALATCDYRSHVVFQMSVAGKNPIFSMLSFPRSLETNHLGPNKDSVKH